MDIYGQKLSFRNEMRLAALSLKRRLGLVSCYRPLCRTCLIYLDYQKNFEGWLIVYGMLEKKPTFRFFSAKLE